MQTTLLSPAIAKQHNFLHHDAIDGPTQLNSKHILRVIDSASKAENEIRDAKFDLGAIFAGDTISDFGKTPEGKALLTTQSADSDLLISALRGDAGSKSGRLIQEVLTEVFGQQQSTLINPELTNDQVREQFTSDWRLQMAFHEFPGFIFLIKDFEADEITKADFKKIMLVNLGHNGPNEGWWKGFFESISNDLADSGITLHLGTPFADEDGSMTYPQVQSPEGFTHAAADRMDQAIDGLPKLAKEISAAPGQDIEDLHGNLLGTCQTWTLNQMQVLKQYLPELMKKFDGTEVEKLQKTGFMSRLVDRVSDQILKFRDFIKARLTWSSDEQNGQLLEFRHDDGMVEKLSKDTDGNYSHDIALHQPQDTQDFLGRSAARFLGRVVQGFNESERYRAA